MATTFTERVASVVQLEYAVLILLGSLAAWIFYKIALRRVSAKRHVSLSSKFSNLLKHLAWMIAFGVPYFVLSDKLSPHVFAVKLLPYLGLVTLFCATLTLIKLTRISVLEFLFLGHMKAGVPLLIVNIFTLVLSLGLMAWYCSAILEIRLAPLLATSAVFSIVLGLALQDTISNLFAGLGLQFDESFQIGDWVEIVQDQQKWAGRVEEISWRSTVLMSLTDEMVIIPNRTISQALIQNYSNSTRTFLRSQLVKIDYDIPQEDVRELLIEAARSVDGVSKESPPSVLFWELHESYAVYKLIYTIHDFGRQFGIADHVLSNISAALQNKKMRIATLKLEVKGKSDV